eukprot:CAMPEP_0113532018 /NCGR_PEP_ID=MMETSP0015_2-20120614/3816_1 /TAXON_ID=2838 /ORGANISM="Odontella" /LENGTH=106 /DNA_ID=CAMNT_0000430913 /DNA_START=28 /DNA_END=348 /DNA_ORIENTATION=+ /assembly_acc=CAM_ASM_000160
MMRKITITAAFFLLRIVPVESSPAHDTARVQSGISHQKNVVQIKDLWGHRFGPNHPKPPQDVLRALRGGGGSISLEDVHDVLKKVSEEVKPDHMAAAGIAPDIHAL